MPSYQRALGAVVTASLVSAGLVTGSAAVAAHAAPAHPGVAEAAVPGLPGIPELPGAPGLDALPLPTEPPRLEGIPEVGRLLTVVRPVFATLLAPLQDLLAFDVVWLCNGEQVPGSEQLWSFAPSELQAGCDLAAKVTTTLVGLLPLESITSALHVPGPGSTAPKATTPVSIKAVAGGAKVGTLLEAVAPVWDTSADTTYQWLRGGVVIPGATSTTYTVVGEDALKAIAVRATGAKDAGTPGMSVSDAVTPALGDAAKPLGRPSFVGRAAVGETLVGRAPQWDATNVTNAYQWVRDGQAIAGATKQDYTVRGADAGRSIALVISGARVGHLSGTAASDPVKVAKAASATRASLAGKKVRPGSKGVLRIAVRATGVTPVGKVTVLDRGRKLRTYALRASDAGSRSVKLPRLGPGKHRLRAVYAGSPTTAGSRSTVVVLTVLRKK